MLTERLELHARGLSRCCGQRQLLVRSRAGGFISKNCCGCGKPRCVTLDELPAVSCECCGQAMQPGLRFKNYCYDCPTCGHSFSVFARVEKWQQRFDYCGLATPSDMRDA